MMSGGSRLRWLRVGIAAVFLVLRSPAPAAAAVDGPCSASFNGVAVDRIDSLASPLELTVDDQLTFHGEDSVGTQNASVHIVLASVQLDEGVSTYGPVQNDFVASLDLGDVAPYGVGLFRVRGTTDNCIAEAWLRVGGRLPLATLTGITGLGLALGGVTGQLAAVAARRRRGWLTAGLAGIATGIGAALLGQQFGRLQLSYISITAAALVAIFLGALLGFAFRPREGATWSERRRADRDERRERRGEDRIRKDEGRQRRDEEQARQAAGREQRQSERAAAQSRQVRDESTRAVGPADTGERVAARSAAVSPQEVGPYWCYVMSQVEVLDLAQPTRVIAVLQPGTWYLVRREAGEWAHVVAEENLEGWAPLSAVHRHG